MSIIGTPCWLDLTTDLDKVRPFYEAVLGWTFTDLGPDWGGWHMASVGDVEVAAIGPGEPRDWQVFLASSDLEATVEAAVAAGGGVSLQPGQVGDMGSAAQISDPGGANVGLWQGGGHAGWVPSGAVGTPVWFEVNTRHGEQVRDFFASLFGLEHQKQEGMAYYTLHAQDRPRYGVLQMNKDWDGMDPCWMVYFAVADIDASCEVVKASGGVVEYGPFDTPFGRIAICRDPMRTPLTLMVPS